MAPESQSTEEQVQANLPMLQWVSLAHVVPMLRELMAFNDGGRFIVQRWDCKYIDARIDMRTGAVFLKPGGAPAITIEEERTKRQQAEHERDCAKEKLADLQNLLGAWLQWFGSTNDLSDRTRRALDVPAERRMSCQRCVRADGCAEGHCEYGIQPDTRKAK